LAWGRRLAYPTKEYGNLRLPGRRLAERRLRGGEPRDLHAERRAGHVVESGLMAERHRGRVAAVLTADADLESLSGLAAALDADADQRADACGIDRYERIARDEAARRVDAEEACGIVAADAEGGLGQVVGAEREELGASGDIVGQERRPRQLDHGADLVLQPGAGLLSHRRGHGVDPRLDDVE